MAGLDPAIHALLNRVMLIRPASVADYAAIWRILEPVIRAGETYALPREMSEGEAIAYWTGSDR